MSGGGSSNKKSTPAKKEEPIIPGSGPMMTQPAFLPGMDTMLAQQLAAGYGMNPNDLLAQFAQTFTPMQVLDTRPGAIPAPGVPSTPSTGSNSAPEWYQKMRESGSKALGRGAFLNWGNR